MMLEYTLTCTPTNTVNTNIQTVHFHLWFNEHLDNTYNLSETLSINRTKLLNLCQKLINEIINRNMLESNRFPTHMSNEIFEAVRDDPCIQILADCIPLDLFHSLHPLLRTTVVNTTLSVFFSLHA